GHLATRVARGISGGEAQRVSLARAFALEPEVLFLDEPFAAVDAPTRARLVDELLDILAESGAAAVLVSHDPAELVDVCDRTMILDAGRVLQDGPAAEVFRLPRSRRVAEIIGAQNLIHAIVKASNHAGTELDWDRETITVPRLCAAPGTAVTLGSPPKRSRSSSHRRRCQPACSSVRSRVSASETADVWSRSGCPTAVRSTR
ncbi:MAG TPA: ATP-binding cassette domain-containing protein, partial [Gemmatimonadaceae bacterium]